MTASFNFDPKSLMTSEELERFQLEQRQRIAAIVERGKAARAELEATEFEARTPDGAITVVVGAGGILKDLRFGPKASGLPPTQLRSAILKAYREGCQSVAERSAAAVARIGGGTDDPSTQMLRDAIPRLDLDEDGEVR